MSVWQITVSFALAACAILCLLGICRAIGSLSKGVLSIRTELAKLTSKLEAVEVISKDDKRDLDDSFEAIEAAVSNFEKLKRVDITKPE